MSLLKIRSLKTRHKREVMAQGHVATLRSGKRLSSIGEQVAKRAPCHRRGMMPLVPLLLFLFVGASCRCGEEERCGDHSKQDLEKCKFDADKLQAEIILLKRQLAQALANPGTIKVDPSVLMINGKMIQPPKPKEGTLSQEQVIATMRQNKNVLQACYERAMKKNTSLTQQKITITVGFSVKPSGSAENISISPNYDSMMIDCMKKAIIRWRFPSFEGQPVGVETPITLTPRR